MKKQKSLALTAAMLVMFSIVSSAAPRAPRIQTGPDAEVTFDGLHRVDRSVMDIAWAKPTLDLTGYSKVLLISSGFAYREVDEVSRLDRRAEEFPISDENRRRIEETFREILLEELENLENWEIVSEPGRDVLIVAGAMIDIISAVPPETAGRSDVYLTRVGEATLVLELHDSMSNEILARAVDRRAAEAAFPAEASTVTTRSAVRRLARTWARVVVGRLDQLAEL